MKKTFSECQQQIQHNISGFNVEFLLQTYIEKLFPSYKLFTKLDVRTATTAAQDTTPPTCLPTLLTVEYLGGVTAHAARLPAHIAQVAGGRATILRHGKTVLVQRKLSFEDDIFRDCLNNKTVL